MKRYMAILLLMLLACGSHNNPQEIIPNRHVDPNTIVAFVDMNGNFYPDNWETSIGPYRRHSSLFLTAKRRNVLTTLTNFEKSNLNASATVLKNKKRVFIFVHGYNNSAKESKANYDLLRTKLRLDPIQDEVIEFYWDGMVSKTMSGSAKIWFNATGYSQMAGEFGLRKILNQISGKDIYIISHSRGASVVLSAISNPPYAPSFRSDTERLGIQVDNPEPLAENNNNIVCLMMAPAVGEIDFRQVRDYQKFRAFSKQLSAIHITVNKDDQILNKFLNKANNFNPTTLGHDTIAYNTLNPVYKF
ncbi:MAG: alpha/beta hydrolase, partial [Moraxellaceae bacterium]